MLTRAREAGAVTVACHPNEQSDWFANTFYLWNRRQEIALSSTSGSSPAAGTSSRRSPARASPTSANSDFHDRPHLWAWKTLLNCEKTPGRRPRGAPRRPGLGVTRLPAPAPRPRAHPERDASPSRPCTIVPGFVEPAAGVRAP